MYKLIISIAALFLSLNIFGLQNQPIHVLEQPSDTLLIPGGDSTEYDIIIIEVGYENWLITNAQPKWYYSNEYYRNKNQFYVIDWNNRVIETMGRPPFEEQIFYNPNTDYGLDVNYKLYWYFKFIEHKYDVKLRGGGKDSF